MVHDADRRTCMSNRNVLKYTRPKDCAGVSLKMFALWLFLVAFVATASAARFANYTLDINNAMASCVATSNRTDLPPWVCLGSSIDGVVELEGSSSDDGLTRTWRASQYDGDALGQTFFMQIETPSEGNLLKSIQMGFVKQPHPIAFSFRVFRKSVVNPLQFCHGPRYEQCCVEGHCPSTHLRLRVAGDNPLVVFAGGFDWGVQVGPVCDSGCMGNFTVSFKLNWPGLQTLRMMRQDFVQN